MTSRRGFTMLEVILAAVLGALLVGVCLTMFSLLSNSQRAAERVADRQIELATLRDTLQAAFRQLVVNQRQRPRLNPQGGVAATAIPTTGPRADGSADGAEPESTGGAPPRIVLAKDARNQVQSLELVMSRAPISVRLRDGHTALANPEAGGGVRGRFELRPEPKTSGWAVWYVARATSTDAEERSVGEGERRLAGGLKQFRFTFWRTGKRPDGKTSGRLEKFQEFTATDVTEVPAYIEAEVETNEGQKHRWMFEVAYIIGREQETMPEVDPALSSRLQERRRGLLDGGRGGNDQPAGRKPTEGSRKPE